MATVSMVIRRREIRAEKIKNGICTFQNCKNKSTTGKNTCAKCRKILHERYLNSKKKEIKKWKKVK